jgi:GH43 family beta-xylosidase
VVRDAAGGRYLWCQSEDDRGIAVWTSSGLTGMGEQHVVWRAPDTGPVSRQVWAPELHCLDGRWHIYFAASDGRNEQHLAYVLRARTDDPLGPYDLHGPLATGDGPDGRSPHVWAIDMTVLEQQDRRYAIWSGWDRPGSDQQFLYIAQMRSPVELAGSRVRLCANDDHPWERTEPAPAGRGLNEGPQVLRGGDRLFVVYSCAASWLPSYRLGLLELVGTDPLQPGHWRKHAQPVFTGTERTFGVGHSCFVPSPDGHEWWHVYHAKRTREPGWPRDMMLQPFRFDAAGFPQFGEPIARGQPLPAPSGEPAGTQRPAR